jgi:hypothetical protein
MAVSTNPADHLEGGGVPEPGTYRIAECRATRFDWFGKAPVRTCVYVDLRDKDGESVSPRYYSCGDEDDKKRFRPTPDKLGIDSKDDAELAKQSRASLFFQHMFNAGYPGIMGSDLSSYDGTTWEWDQVPVQSRNEAGVRSEKVELFPVKYISGPEQTPRSPAANTSEDDDEIFERMADILMENINGRMSKTELGRLVKASDDPLVSVSSQKVYNKAFTKVITDRGLREQGNNFLAAE